MARTVLPIAGAIIGAYFGAPQVGFMIGSLAAGAIPTHSQGPRIGETGAQTSVEGAPRAIVYATAPVTGNVICSGPLIKADVSESAGKGGGNTTSTQHCYRTFAIRICEGPIRGVLRIWEDDKLVYDVRSGSTMLAESAKWAFGCGIYLGDETQLPDPFLQINVTADMPAYRGTAYMVFVFRDLTDRRGSIPQYRFEVSTTTEAVTPGAGWFDYVQFTGTGSAVTFDSLDLSLGGLVWVVRQDATEAVKMYYTLEGGGDVYQMGNATIVGGPPPDNPTTSAALFYADGRISLPASTSGATYMAYVFKASAGNFNIKTYVGNGSAGHTISHDLGSVPKMHFLRQLNDPAATIGYMHLAHFNGLAHLQITAGGNVSTSSQQWNDTAPTSSYVTLGNHTSVNGSGRGYVMFLFGGDDCFNNLSTAGTDLSVGFEPTFAFAKRRDSGSDSFSYNLITGASAPGFDGLEHLSYGSGSGGVAFNEERIAKVSAGVYEFGAGSGWTATSVDSFFIRGSTASTPTDLTLGDVVSDIHARCGVPSAKYDTDELTDLISGLVLAGEYTGADAVNTLRSPYFFDKIETGKQLTYPKRGKAVVGTLTIDDLVEIPDDKTRQQAAEYPKKFHLFYQHAASGYARVKETRTRSSPDVRVTGEMSAEIPVVMSEDQASQASDMMLKVAWADAEGEVTLAVPESFLKWTPGDNIGLSLRGRVSRLRIEKAEHADGVLHWTLKTDRQSAYTSTVTGVPVPLPTAPPPTITGDTQLAVMDIPGRVDNEDDLSLYYAVSGVMPAWHGSTVQRSTDAGANYASVLSIDGAAVMGSLVNPITAASEHYTDRTNVVRVQLYITTQTIDALSDAQFLSEQGAFALQNADGSWEILQRRDVTNIGGGIFDLQTLHRGRLNSGATAKLAGAVFVMLDDAKHVAAQSSWIGQSLTHRAPSFDQSPELATAQTRAYVGRSQIEWPVASFALSRSGNNVTATWAPRHRFGTDDAPLASINFQGYRVTIVGTSTVTFDQTAATFTYDVSAIGGAVTVSVAAINRITGAGPATSGAI